MRTTFSYTTSRSPLLRLASLRLVLALAINTAIVTIPRVNGGTLMKIVHEKDGNSAVFCIYAGF